MTHNFSNKSIEQLYIYSLVKQQKALEYLFERAATQLSMGAQDIIAILGLDIPDRIESGNCLLSYTLCLSTQRSLFELVKLLDLLSSMPDSKAYNRRWLMTPNYMLEDLAPIDLILADTLRGTSQVRTIISRGNTHITNWETNAKHCPMANVTKHEVKVKPSVCDTHILGVDQ